MATKKKFLGAAAGTAASAGGGVTRTADFFDISMYSGTGAANNNIVNYLDLSGDGGFVLLKNFSVGAASAWRLFDTERGNGVWFNNPNQNGGSDSAALTFNSDGFTVGALNQTNQTGSNSQAHKAFCFKNASGYFKVVSWTGDGTNGRTITHGLGATIGVAWVMSNNSNRLMYHRSLGYTQGLRIDSTQTNNSSYAVFTEAPTDTSFKVKSSVNSNGVTYVAYLWAHSPDDFINAGVYYGTGNANAISINLGWRPKFVLIKNGDQSRHTHIFDNRNGIMTFELSSGKSQRSSLYLSDSYAQSAGLDLEFHAEGFEVKDTNFSVNGSSNSIYYLAIRDDTMKAENITAGTDIWHQQGYTGNSNSPTRKYFNTTSMGGHGMDAAIVQTRGEVGSGGSGVNANLLVQPELGNRLFSGTPADSGYGDYSDIRSYDNGSYMENWGSVPGWCDWWETGGNSSKGFGIQKYESSQSTTYMGDSTTSHTIHKLKRAESFMDCLIYKGNGSAGHTIPHQLGTTPKMIWTHRFSEVGTSRAWVCYNEANGNTGVIRLSNQTSETSGNTGLWNSTDPTDTEFTLGSSGAVNASGVYYQAWVWGEGDYSAYGTYTGNGGTKQITLPFTPQTVMIGGVGHSTGVWWFDKTIGSGNQSKHLRMYTGATSTAALSQGTRFINFGNSSTLTVYARSTDYNYPDQINANGYNYWYYAVSS